MVIRPSALNESTIEKKVKKSSQTKTKKTEEKLEKAKEILKAEEAYYRGVATVRDLIAPSSLSVNSKYLRLGDRFLRTLFVTTFPRYISVGWFVPIINFNAYLDVSMFFYPVKTKIILKQLQSQVGNIESEISTNREKGMPRDPLRETALKDIESLRDKLTTGVEHFFQFALYTTIYAKSEKELDILTEKIESLFASRLVKTRRAFYQSEQGFNTTLPLAQDKLMVFVNMNSSPCASSFPFISSDLTSDKGILYGINRHNNSLILFDRFSMPNANFVVFATSGSGKSIKGSEPVLIKDRKEVKLTKIGPLIERVIKKRGAVQLEEEIEGVIDPEIEVYSFDKNFKGGWSKVTVAARKKAPKILYRFKTRSGRSITTTGDHNMLVLRNGKLVADKSEQIKSGEHVPLTRELPEPKNPIKYFNLLSLLRDSNRIYVDGGQKIIQQNYQVLKKARINPGLDKYLYKYRQNRRMPIGYFWQILDYLEINPDKCLIKNIKVCSCQNQKRKDTTLPALLKITPEFMRILGYIISEGTTGDKFVLITNQDIEVQNDIRQCLENLNIAYYIRANKTFAMTGRVFIELIRVLGAFGKSGEKRVPPFIFNASNYYLAEFLKAYFEGDGGIETCTVVAVSKSPDLISDFCYLLSRYGIISRSTSRKKRATNGSASGFYQFLTISGSENLAKFAQYINFFSDSKKQRLSHILGKKANTNVDIIPETQEIFREIYRLFHSQLHGIQDVIELKNGSYKPSRKKLKEVIKKVEQRIEYFKGLDNKFGILKTLPTLNSIINLGKNNIDLNSALWQTLGQSWRLMKNQEVQPRSANVFKVAQIISGNSYSLTNIKETINAGFKEMNLPIKYYNRSLQIALIDRPKSNTRYDIIQEAAEFVWQNYQKMLARIPQVEEKLIQLRTLAHSGLFWDPIVKIEKINNKDKYVYDLMVDNEVFLAGQNGLFVHNSYFCKLEVLRSLMMGVDVIIIDPEKEYKHLSDAVGGTYLDISLSGESKINPFDLPRPSSKETKTADIIRGGVITIKGLLKIMIGKRFQGGVRGFDPKEDSLMDRALLETYAKKDIVPGCDLNKVEVPTLSDLQDILSGMEGGQDLAERLKKYTGGTFSGFLNNRTNVKMNNQLVVFSVRDLEDELRPMAIYTIINYIWNVVRSKLKKRILFIDEAWWLMQHEDSAKFIFALIKRCRKYYLGVTTITQDVQDFLTSPYGRAIVTNSALQLLLKQSPAAIDTLVKTFMLTEGEKYLLLECGLGEGIFFAGTKHVAIKVVASYSEDQLITSDPKQMLEIEESKREFAESMEREK